MRSIFVTALVAFSIWTAPAFADGGPEMTPAQMEEMVRVMLAAPEEVQEKRRAMLAVAQPSTDPVFVNGCHLLVEAFVQSDIIAARFDNGNVTDEQVAQLADWIVTTEEIEEHLGAALQCHATL